MPIGVHLTPYETRGLTGAAPHLGQREGLPSLFPAIPLTPPVAQFCAGVTGFAKARGCAVAANYNNSDAMLMLRVVVCRANERTSALAPDFQEPLSRCYVPVSAPYSVNGKSELEASIATTHEPSGCFSRIRSILPLSLAGSRIPSALKERA